MVDKALFAMIEYFGTSRQRIEHTMAVCGYARVIGLQEGLDPERMEFVECAAALHNIGVRESERAYGSVCGDYKERMSARLAGELLQSLRFSREQIENIVHLIRHHRSYGQSISKAHDILVDAVLLAEIGEFPKADLERISGQLHTKCGSQLFHTLCGIQPDLPVRAV